MERHVANGTVMTGLGVLGLAGFVAAFAVFGRNTPEPSTRPGWEVEAETGQHRRIETPNGPVHLFVPKAYDSSTAGTVFYVHGYFNDVDSAWKQHELATQFASSGRNALFVVPEAPVGANDGVRWQNLGSLMETVARQGEIEVPTGPSVVMVHSGGWRTLQPWLGVGDIDTVLMLDGLYGAEAELTKWLGDRGNHPVSLVLVGFDTTPQTEKFIAAFPDAETLDEVPAIARTKRSSHKGRLVFMRSQYGHMEIVTQGSVIPSVLQLTPLGALGSSS